MRKKVGKNFGAIKGRDRDEIEDGEDDIDDCNPNKSLINGGGEWRGESKSQGADEDKGNDKIGQGTGEGNNSARFANIFSLYFLHINGNRLGPPNDDWLYAKESRNGKNEWENNRPKGIDVINRIKVETIVALRGIIAVG